MSLSDQHIQATQLEKWRARAEQAEKQLADLKCKAPVIEYDPDCNHASDPIEKALYIVADSILRHIRSAKDWDCRDTCWLQDVTQARGLIKAELAAVNKSHVEEVERALNLEEQLAEVREWKESVSKAVQCLPEFQAGEWVGDKYGWGFHVELIAWLNRFRNELKAELAAKDAEINRLSEALGKARAFIGREFPNEQYSEILDKIDRTKDAEIAAKDARIKELEQQIQDIDPLFH